MALTRALVDRGRKFEKARTGRKVEGTTQYVNTGGGEWFRCRLTLPGASRNTGSGGEPVTSVNAAADLLCGVKDLTGALLSFKAGDRVEIDSVQLGRMTWALAGDPEPIRARKKLIGWQARLTRVQQGDTPPQIHTEKVRAMADRISPSDRVTHVRVRAS